MPRLVIVLPLAPLAVGQSFAVARWPLHITVVRPFLTDAEPERIVDALDAALHPGAGHRALAAVAGADALFGRRNNIPVSLIAPNPPLLALSRTLADAVLPWASNPHEAAFDEAGVQPHVTAKGAARLVPGQRIALRQIAVVDMLPRDHPAGRTVLAVLPLSAQADDAGQQHRERRPGLAR